MQNVKDSPYGWATGKPGWVLLHDNEKRIMQLMMTSMKAVELEELEIELIEGGVRPILAVTPEPQVVMMGLLRSAPAASKAALRPSKATRKTYLTGPSSPPRSSVRRRSLSAPSTCSALAMPA